jgi:hypothetical protein
MGMQIHLDETSDKEMLKELEAYYSLDRVRNKKELF